MRPARPELRRRLGRAHGLTVAAPRGSGAGGCPCTCAYGTDPGCQCRSLPTPLNITLTKTPTVAVYPLTYLQSFDEQPFEARSPSRPPRRLAKSVPCLAGAGKSQLRQLEPHRQPHSRH